MLTLVPRGEWVYSVCTAYTVHALQSARGPKLRATPCPSPPLLVTVGAKATAPSRARARARWRWRCPGGGERDVRELWCAEAVGRAAAGVLGGYAGYAGEGEVYFI